MMTGVAGVIVVALSTCITAYQAVVMRTELNNTLDQQRAWLKVDAVPEAFIASDKGAELLLHVKATNVGSVPALGVEAGTALWPAPGPLAMSKNSPRQLVSNCPTRQNIGTVIFPGETVELFATERRASASDLRHLADEQHHVQVMAIVCVSYRSGGRREARHTTASFGIVKRALKYGIENDDRKMDASHEGIVPPVLQLIRMGVKDEAD